MARGGTLKWKQGKINSVVRAAETGLMRSTMDIYGESQERAPFDDGELTLGARVTSEKKDEIFTTMISYGNDPISMRYAVEQHEDLSINHKPGEQAKFLESAFNEFVDQIPMIIGDYIWDKTGR